MILFLRLPFVFLSDNNTAVFLGIVDDSRNEIFRRMYNNPISAREEGFPLSYRWYRYWHATSRLFVGCWLGVHFPPPHASRNRNPPEKFGWG
jgi:hypothetical protein